MTQENAWHVPNIEGIFKKLETTGRGLTNAEAEKRLLTYGVNELEEEKRISKFALLVSQLKNPLVGVLVAAALISFLVGKLARAMKLQKNEHAIIAQYLDSKSQRIR